MQTYGVEGYPSLLFLNGAGDVVATHVGSRTLAAIEATAAKAAALEKRLEAGEKSARIEIVIGDVEAGRVKLDEIDKKLDGLGELSAEQTKALEAARANGEVDWIYNNTKDGWTWIGKKLLERRKAGKPIPTGLRQFNAYWMGLFDYAQMNKDAALYATLLDELRAHPLRPQRISKNLMTDLEKTLERLRAGKDE